RTTCLWVVVAAEAIGAVARARTERQERVSRHIMNTSYPAKIPVVVTIQEFVKRLAAAPEQEFTQARILDFLRLHPVDPASLDPYLYFSGDHYTRNLIHRTRLFELLAICWDSGQK